ncbi:MAG: IS66 family insertion sequence element accessory protein TnpA [Desulfitobacterium sp.]
MTSLEKRALVEECRQSNLTAKEWCESRGIKYRSYIDWASRVNKEDQAVTLVPMQWADVTSITKNQEKEKETAEVKLICGKWTIAVESGFSPALLAEVLKVVDGVC